MQREILLESETPNSEDEKCRCVWMAQWIYSDVAISTFNYIYKDDMMVKKGSLNDTELYCSIEGKRYR